MIINRLAVLLAERHVKASRVSSETGISRSTLNSISKNDSKMIQLETINNLCSYLKVEPKDFFQFTPYNFNFDFQFPLNKKVMDISEAGGLYSVQLPSYSGDLTLTVLKNYQKVAVYDLTFQIVEGYVFEGYLPFLDTYPMKVQILDTKERSLSHFWTENKLNPFFDELKRISKETFWKSWVNQEVVSPGFAKKLLSTDNFTLNMQLPLAPF